MHKISINHEYHLKKGSTYCALFSGRVGIDRIWGENKSILLKANLYKKSKLFMKCQLTKLKICGQTCIFMQFMEIWDY